MRSRKLASRQVRHAVEGTPNRSLIEPLEQRQLLSASLSTLLVAASSDVSAGILAQSSVTTGTVTGSITDANGTALANAHVHLVPVSSSSTGGYRLRAVTDSNGDYTLDNVPAGSYTVVAKDSGYIKNTSAAFTVAAGDNTAPTVQLTQITYGTVTGSVTDSSGNPLSDARVVLTPQSSSSSSSDGLNGQELIATTDANGDYTINNVVTGSYVVTAHDHGYVKNSSAAFTVASGSNTAPTVQLTAITYGTVTGQITDASGNPLSGVRVRLVAASSTSTSPGSAQNSQGLFATTDSNGDYTINNVLAGSYTVSARDQGYVKNSSAAFTVAAGSNTAPTVQLTALVYGTVTGQITDSSGNALSGARVALTLQSSSSSSQSSGQNPQALFATTDSNGDYTIDNVLAGSYIVSARDQGYVKNSSAAFTVATGSNTAPTVQLTALTYGTVTGQITDANGNALSGASVALVLQSSSSTSQGPGQNSHALFATTDANGDYTISNVLAGSYIVSARDQGYVKNSSAAFTVAAGSDTAPTVQLTALVYGTVSGQITDANGNALSDARVTLALQSSSSSSQGSGQNPQALVATTDSNGDYTINNVLAGSYIVTARDQGYVKNSSAAFTVAVGTTTAPTVQLTAIVYGTVTGQITDSNNSPLANARVELVLASSSSSNGQLPNGSGPALSAITDANGDYTINNVPTGSYTVTAGDRGYQKNTSAAFTVAAGSNTAPTVALTAASTSLMPPAPWNQLDLD